MSAGWRQVFLGWWWMSIGSLAVSAAAPAARWHVLPLAFSEESRRHYATWIAKLEADGCGQAVWQELEDCLYDVPGVELVQSPLADEEFQRVLRARVESAAAGAAPAAGFTLPEQVVTINSSFVVRTQESMSGFKATKSTEFVVTIYLRHYDLAGARLNRAVPAQASATGPDPMTAARTATKAASAKLVERLQAAGLLPKRKSPGEK